MKLFYMNQGGSGANSGPPPYNAYDVLCIAESNGWNKTNFEEQNTFVSVPRMSVQTKSNQPFRTITWISDLDLLYDEVRPLLTFQLRNGVHVVFFHLKSGNVNFATNALHTAVSQYQSKYSNYDNRKTLWIGDFNRANALEVFNNKNFNFAGFQSLFAGGGQAIWDLDRVYITGSWNGNIPVVEQVSKSGDHGHVGIVVTIE